MLKDVNTLEGVGEGIFDPLERLQRWVEHDQRAIRLDARRGGVPPSPALRFGRGSEAAGFRRRHGRGGRLLPARRLVVEPLLFGGHFGFRSHFGYRVHFGDGLGLGAHPLGLDQLEAEFYTQLEDLELRRRVDRLRLERGRRDGIGFEGILLEDQVRDVRDLCFTPTPLFLRNLLEGRHGEVIDGFPTRAAGARLGRRRFVGADAEHLVGRHSVEGRVVRSLFGIGRNGGAEVRRRIGVVSSAASATRRCRRPRR